MSSFPVQESMSQSFREIDESDFFQSFDIKFVVAVVDFPLLPIDEPPLDPLLAIDDPALFALCDASDAFIFTADLSALV